MILRSIAVCITFVAALSQLSAGVLPAFGFFDDGVRIKLMYEDIAVVARSNEELKALQAAPEKDQLRIVRWIETREKRLDDLQNLISGYFLAQRLRPMYEGEPKYEKYILQVTQLHRLLVLSAKARQSLDPDMAFQMKKLLHEFEDDYFTVMPQNKN